MSEKQQRLKREFSINNRKKNSPSFNFESQLIETGLSLIAGVDEVGRGPIAGPVVAASVILKNPKYFQDLNDSKKLTENQRNDLYHRLINSQEVIFGIGIISEKKIDQINILNATFAAMKESISQLKVKPDFLLIDGNKKIPNINISQQTIIKGDQKSLSIAAASIIAKVTRDQMMIELDQCYPQYGFAKHKGYPTQKHIQKIEQYGPCIKHRFTFAPLKDLKQKELF